MAFELVTENLTGLPTTENHFNFQWVNPECDIIFSVTRQGNGASCHFSSDKAGLRKLKQAINEFADFVFWLFPWCSMIMAKSTKPSVGRLMGKCEFKQAVTTPNCTVFIKERI